jgi:hypothetical protein
VCGRSSCSSGSGSPSIYRARRPALLEVHDEPSLSGGSQTSGHCRAVQLQLLSDLPNGYALKVCQGPHDLHGLPHGAGHGGTHPIGHNWRRRRGPPGEPFRDAREETLLRRRRHPGPIYILRDSVEPLETTVAAGPFGTSVLINLEPGVPYVARDEAEADELTDLERQKFVRRIRRDEAYRLRRQRGGRDGVDS